MHVKEIDSVIEAVFYHACRQGDKLCLADDDNSVTYGEYAQMILKCAAFLSGAGIASGDRVIVEACQRIDYLTVQMALALIGAIFIPVEHNCAANKMREFAERVAAAGVIACREHDINVRLSLTHSCLRELCEMTLPLENYRFPHRATVSEILFSTGTTGKEKGIVITHENNLALAENVIQGVEMKTDNVEMIPSPMNHSHGLRRYYANMVNGSTVVLLSSVMNMAKLFEQMDSYGVNSMDMVPAALTVVLRLSRGKLAEYRDRLRYVQFGAAPMRDDDREEICRLLPGTRLYNFYGSTESGCIAIYDFNCPSSKKRCVGKPTCNAKIFLADEQGEEIVPSGNVNGLLASRGSMNTPGYWMELQETKASVRNGCVYSRDVAYFDRDGDIILLGRQDDVINVGGNKVSPEEIENAARCMPCIADCGVIPVDDSGKGSVPKLFVQMRSGYSFDSRAICRFLLESLEPYKVPAYIEAIESIPRSYNGKLLRKKLREIHASSAK